MDPADRWRIVSTALAAVCILLGLQLWVVGVRLQAASARVLSSTSVCPMSLEDLEYS